MQPEVNGIYSVDLLFEDLPSLPADTLLSALERCCPGIEPTATQSDAPDAHVFLLTSHTARYADVALPPQLIVMPGPRGQDSARVDEALQQSWLEPDARNLVQHTKHRVFVSDMMARSLPHKERLSVFLDALDAIISLARPSVIHWHASRQLMKPDRFIAARRGNGEKELLTGPLNVRFFRVAEGSRGDEMIMDTMGLAALGLPDLQCHFHTLRPNNVMAFLYDVGLHMFERGDVFEDGHTVSGGIPRVDWQCRHKDSLVSPLRPVLDIDAGVYAAGR